MQFEAEIIELTEAVWSSVLGLKASRAAPSLGEDSGRLLTGCVQITGPWKGAVTLECPADLARRVAAIMFGVEPAEARLDEIKDALGELTNMIGGNLKSRMPGSCQLSLPAVIEGADYRVSVPGSEPLTELGFECEGRRFRVMVLRTANGQP